MGFTTGWLLQPLFWIGAIILAGALLAFRMQKTGAILCLVGLGLGGLLGWVAVPESLLKSLEESYERPTDLTPFAGVIVLGGTIDGSPLRMKGSGALSNMSERLTRAAALVQSHPGFRLVFTGRERLLPDRNGKPVNAAAVIFEELGVPRSRIAIEDKASNTYENAVFTARMLAAERSSAWLLVTSASHMPRALGAFRKAGVNVSPYPVDFVTNDEVRWTRYSVPEGTLQWQAAIREYAGQALYLLRGRSELD